jgi:hypothetical protein
MFKRYLFAVAAICSASFAVPASAQVTYSFSGFSDVIGGPQSFTLTLNDYLTADRFVPASAFTSCVSATPCQGFQFNLVDPFNNFTDYSLIDFKDDSSGTFYYFKTPDFAANGTYTNEEVGFNLATLTVSGSANAVPEPAAWGMMIGGFGLAGMAMRRRRASLRYA